MRIKEIAFVSYAITDLKASRNFYENVLGLKPQSMFGDETTEMAFVEYEIGPHTLAIGKGAPGFSPSKEGAVAALEVEDFDEALKTLKENNVPLLGEVMDYPSCNMVIVEDPDENRIIIHKRKTT